MDCNTTTMDYKQNFLRGRNQLLNNPGFHSNAAISYKIEGCDKLFKDKNNTITKSQYIDVDLYISDCNRTITILMDSNTPEGIENSLYKANTLISVLEELRTELNFIKNSRIEFDKLYNSLSNKKDDEEEATTDSLEEFINSLNM